MKSKSEKTVVLGMSGGVDSSVSALLLKQKGYKVIGVFLRSYPDNTNYLDSECPFKPDKQIAEKLAEKLGIEFQVVDYRKQYMSLVINPMIKSYKKNLTPNPDVQCNALIKFPVLWKIAKKFKADFIATGHYSRIKKTSLGFQLLRGVDSTKDQSYFLHELNQFDLSHTLFPLGNLTKKEVREVAKKNGFSNHDKQGSRGICFVGKTDMKSLLKANLSSSPGPVLSPEKRVVGTHPGSIFFTIGERIGPKHQVVIDDKYRNKEKSKLYVAKKEGNTITIAPQNHPILKTKEVKIQSLHKINPKTKIPPTGLKARIRHLGALHSGKLTLTPKPKFTFSKAQEGIAPGQSIVFYKNKSLVCAGEISN